MSLEYVTSRLGNVKAETRAIAAEIYNAAKAAGHEIWFMWGMGTSTEHSSGLALDLMVRNEAGGDFIRNYLWANRARLRLRHVIWEQHITSTVTKPGERRKMEDRGNPTANHYDHVHTWHFAGAYQAPSGSTPTPAPSGDLVVDGELGPKTIRRWQQVMGTPVTGVISAKNSALVKAVQTKLKATVDRRLVVDGILGPKTIGRLQQYLGSPIDQVITKPKSQMVMALQRRLNEKPPRF